VLATAAILIGQFLLLAGSDFKPTASFGLMTATALAAGLIFELLLLPALLVMWYGRGRAHQVVPPARSLRSSAVSRPAVSGPGDDAAGAPSSPGRHHVLVCQGEPCRRGGAAQLWRLLRAEQQRLIDDGQGHQIHLTKTGCLGPCRFSPVIQVYPQGTVYGPLEPEDLTRVIESHIRRDQPLGDLQVHETEQARADKGA
jgi:(2Fe-2S) ferredoxin